MIDQEYVRRMRAKAKSDAQRFEKDPQNNEMGEAHHKTEKPEYEGKTYLYIKAYNGDLGVRPIPSGICYWLSPDIELYDATGLVDTAQPLIANKDYTVKVMVTNDGDHDCSTCTVDLYLATPSIGFTVAGANQIGIMNAQVLNHATTVFEFPFKTTAAMGGHKCMFARAYSILNNDFPADFNGFKTWEDRHIGQQNLNIVQQGNAFEFNVDQGFKFKARFMEIILKPETKRFKRNMKITKKHIVSSKTIRTDLFKFSRRDVPQEELILRPGVRPAKLEEVLYRPSTKVRPIKIKALEVKPLLKDTWLHRFDESINKMKVEIPMLGLEKNEAVPMNLMVKDPETGAIIGGITVLVVG